MVVIPAEAGIQVLAVGFGLGSRLRGNDYPPRGNDNAPRGNDTSRCHDDIGERRQRGALWRDPKAGRILFSIKFNKL
jgi:hypothetical protein